MSTMTFRTSNPALRESAFQRARMEDDRTTGAMTVQGTSIKALLLTGIVLATAIFTWSQTLVGLPALEAGVRGAAVAGAIPPALMGYVLVGCLGGFIVALITIFFPKASPITAPIYAALEGLALGGISAVFELYFPGIVLQAVTLTIGVLFFLLLVYSTGWIKVTEGFKAGVVAATGAIALVYLVDIVMSFFGVRIPYIHESGWIGIGFSLFVVVIASLNLVLDFNLIAENARYGAPKFMEWYCAFSLLVTLVWLYLEVLRLLAKLRGGRD